MNRILIVEDSPTQAEKLRFILEAERYEVDHAPDGEAALEMFNPARHSLIISDIVMPGISGYEFCRKIKLEQGAKEVPVILLSTLNDPMDIVRGLECGADNFVTKPYEPEQLINRVQTVLENRRLRMQSRFNLGVEVMFLNRRFTITSDKEQILDLLMSTFEDIVKTNRGLQESKAKLAAANAALARQTEELERRVQERTRDLSARQQQLAEAQAIARLGDWRWPKGADVYIWSDEMYRIVGADKTSFTPTIANVKAMIHADDRELVQSVIDDAIAGRKSFRCEFRLRLVQGGERYCWMEGHCELDADGNLIALFGICQDITERKEAEIALQRTNERNRQLVEHSQSIQSFLDTVIENIPGMVFVKDAQSQRLVLVNRAGLDLLGYSRAELTGKHVTDLFPSDVAEILAERDIDALEAKGPIVTPEEEIATRHRGVRILRTTRVPVLNEQGKPQFLLGFAEDITEQKNVERQLHQAQKMEAVGQLTGGIAHDFNNLLTIIISNLDLLQARLDKMPDCQRLAEAALKASLRGADLTKQLLAFSRRQELQPKTVNLNEIVQNVASLLKRTLGERIEIAQHQEDNPWLVEVDVAQLESALVNLAINARDAMPNGGILCVETKNVTFNEPEPDHGDEICPGDYVMIAVVDNGCGIPQDILHKVFEPFFTTKGVGKGTGLGLSMVYGFAKQSGGHVKIESTEGEGTAVRIYLPRSQRSKDLVVAEQQGTGTTDEAGAGRILVVEDNADVRASVVEQLAILGYNTIEAENGVQALELLEKGEQVDLLFTDIVMPGGLSGIQLAQKAQEAYPDLKIIFTSGFTEASVRGGSALPAGANLLTKPYRRHELAQKIRDVLGRPPS